MVTGGGGGGVGGGGVNNSKHHNNNGGAGGGGNGNNNNPNNDGNNNGGLVMAIGGMPPEIQRNMAPHEHEFLSSYRNILEELKGAFLDVDLGAALVPSKDVFIEVRVMKDIGRW
jgi:hypothetical protein